MAVFSAVTQIYLETIFKKNILIQTKIKIKNFYKNWKMTY